jgi:hypothetical protein
MQIDFRQHFVTENINNFQPSRSAYIKNNRRKVDYHCIMLNMKEAGTYVKENM